MNIPKDLRIHLNRLSKEILGSSSKWQKTMMRGERMGNTMAYPTLEEVQASLKARAKEKAEAEAAKAANPPPGNVEVKVNG